MRSRLTIRFLPVLSSGRDFWIPLLAVFARLASPVTADLSFLILAGYALLGRRQVIQALALSWLLTMISPGLAAEAANASIGRYAVLFAGFVSIAVRGGFLRLDRFAAYTIVLGLFFIGHALIFSPMLDVSILKALSWLLAMATLLSAWSGLNFAERAALQSWLFGFLIIIALVSLSTIMVPNIGYLRNGSGFQGILNHPQAFGPTMALLGALGNPP